MLDSTNVQLSTSSWADSTKEHRATEIHQRNVTSLMRITHHVKITYHVQ